MLFGACGCGVCCGGTAICDINPEIKKKALQNLLNLIEISGAYREDCKVEFHDGFALYNPILVLVDDKQTDRVLTDHYQVQHCEVF